METKIAPRSSWWWGALSFLVAGAAFYLAFTRIDRRLCLQLIRSARPGWLLFGFFFFYLSVPLRAWRWRILLQNLGHEVSPFLLSSLVFRAWTVNAVLPGRPGDLYAAIALKKEWGLEISSTLGTILVARVLDALVLVSLVLVSSALLAGMGASSVFGTIARVALALGGSVVLGTWTIRHTPAWITRWVPASVLERYRAFQSAFSGSFLRGAQPVALTFGLWALEVVRLASMLGALRQPHPMPQVGLMALGAAVLTTVPITPSGLGTVTLYYQHVLRELGISTEMATSVALLDQLIGYWFILIAGGLYFGFLRLRTGGRRSS